MSAIDQLVHISSPPLIGSALPDGIPALAPFGARGTELYELLTRRNGFYAFESALHVLPYGSSDQVLDLGTWNAAETWRGQYGDLGDGCLFFAEDAVGSQSCLRGGEVCAFDGETGHIAQVAGSLEQWAARLLVDYSTMLAYPLAHEWQVANGALAPGRRLAPKTPFVAGGAFNAANLYAAEQVELMRFRGSLATQIRDLPDGTKIVLKVSD